MDLRSYIRDVPNFPQEGIIFKDITTLLKNGPAFRYAIDQIVKHYKGRLHPDAVAGIESRGFIVAAPVALELGVGFIPVRKFGKLPAATYEMEYELEYGKDVLSIHQDAVHSGQKILIVDDLLATGGTAAAVTRLIEKAGGRVMSIAFLIELAALAGRKKLKGHEIFRIIEY